MTGIDYIARADALSREAETFATQYLAMKRVHRNHQSLRWKLLRLVNVVIGFGLLVFSLFGPWFESVELTALASIPLILLCNKLLEEETRLEKLVVASLREKHVQSLRLAARLAGLHAEIKKASAT